MNQTLSFFLIGMAGAAAPEILRLYTLVRNQQTFTWSSAYIIISLLFAALGGLMAILTGGGTAISAFYAGISTPVLITTAAKKTQKKKGPMMKGAALSMSRFETFLEGL